LGELSAKCGEHQYLIYSGCPVLSTRRASGALRSGWFDAVGTGYLCNLFVMAEVQVAEHSGKYCPGLSGGIKTFFVA
jgi:hypothetical protein